jgi:hypothetical protein
VVVVAVLEVAVTVRRLLWLAGVAVLEGLTPEAVVVAQQVHSVEAQAVLVALV